jgi:hypothetical protein
VLPLLNLPCVCFWYLTGACLVQLVVVFLSVQVNPQFFTFNPDCEFDSFVTIGLDGPALTPGALSTVGITFEQWTESNGISTENGAVFFMVRVFALPLLLLRTIARGHCSHAFFRCHA